MALTSCPSCNKRVSSKAAQCPHCDYALNGQSSTDLDRERDRLLSYRKDKLTQQSMLALLIAIGAFAYFFLAQPAPDSTPYTVSLGLLIGGFIWYLINRVRMMLLKRKR